MTLSRTGVGVEAAKHVGGNLDKLRLMWIKVQVGGVIDHEIALNRLQVSVADQKLRIALMHGELVIRVQDDGRVAIVTHFENAKLSVPFFKAKSPKVVEDLKRRRRTRHIDHLNLFGPINFVQSDVFTALSEEGGKKILTFLV